jgi:hypothetical protein
MVETEFFIDSSSGLLIVHRDQVGVDSDTIALEF